MEDLFRSYWWLLFPLGWFAVSGWTSFLNYRRQKRTLDLIQTYAEKGQEPPEALLRIMERPIDSDAEMFGGNATNPARKGDGAWFCVVLFAVMAVGFGYGSYTDVYGSGPALMIVAFVFAAISLASLVPALRSRRREP